MKIGQDPGLVINELFYTIVAREAGIAVPEFYLSAITKAIRLLPA